MCNDQYSIFKPIHFSSYRKNPSRLFFILLAFRWPFYVHLFSSTKFSFGLTGVPIIIVS